MQSFLIASPVTEDFKAALAGLHPITQQLLYNRGIRDTETATTFLSPSYEAHLHDPFLLHQMDVAVERILAAITNQECIVIFSDYDCDGIPGAVVLHDLFAVIGYTNTVHVIPHRHYDGFGLSVKAIEAMAAEYHPAVVITIDCGTGDYDAIAKANALGIDVIVTDHHEPKETLPEALAIVNPKLGAYPFPDLCGAAVAFKLAQAVISKGGFEVPVGTEKWWLDMVGLATIADMVPLTGENRVLALYGLKVLRKSRRPGLQQLLRAQRANQAYLTEDDIGFTIGPRINAASRMDTPEDAFRLLATTDEGEAGSLVTHLEQLNTDRKTAGILITKDIHKRLKLSVDIPSVLVMGNPEWRPSLVGLAANKLAEEHKRPAFLWGRDGNGSYKGSCRSGGGISVITIMDAASDVFVEFGGHHHSGGFTIAAERIHTFSDALIAAYERLGEAAVITELPTVDAELTLDVIDESFIKGQAKCAPFGAANPKPLYLFRNITPTKTAVFGKTKEHTKLSFETSGRAREAIAFFKTPEQFAHVPVVGESLSLLAHLEQSFFMGRLETRLRIVDIV